MFDTTKPALTKAAVIVALPFLLAVGMVAGGLIAPSSRVVTALDGSDGRGCGSDACVKIEKSGGPTSTVALMPPMQTTDATF